MNPPKKENGQVLCFLYKDIQQILPLLSLYYAIFLISLIFREVEMEIAEKLREIKLMNVEDQLTECE